MPASRYQTRLPEHDPEAQSAIEHARIAATFRPVFVWLLTLGVAFVLHLVLPAGPVALGIAVLGAGSAVMALWHARTRKDPLHKFLPAATCITAALWMAWADLTGLHWHWTLGCWLVFGGFCVFAWELAVHMGKGQGVHNDISAWFREAAHHTSVPGMTLHVKEAGPGRVSAEIIAPRGTPPDKVQAAVSELESAGDVPSGTLTTSPGPTARRLAATLINPATLDSSRLYPGPSREGTSIAEPLRWGRFADGTDWQSSLFPKGMPGYQLLITGMTGAAKTTGPGYVCLAEAMTRHDAAIIAFDPRKGEQFLGPLRPGLHHLATDMDDVTDKLWRLNLLARARMDHLGRLGLPHWTEDCELTGVIAWMEEAALVLEALGKPAVAKWVLPTILAARSAGIFACLSLQRASWDQIPPVIRAQLHSICMGVHAKKDADFGLSHDQRAAGCDPGKWASAHPGKCFTDMPDVSARHQVMAARTDWFGPDATLIAAHAARYPAADRPLDDLTAHYLTAPIEDLGGLPDTAARTRQGLARPQGPPHLRVVSTPQPPIEDPAIPAVPGDPHDKLRAYVEDLHAAGNQVVTKADLKHLTNPKSPTYIGRTDKWLYTAMRKIAVTGLVTEVDDPPPRHWPFTQPLDTTEAEEDA